MKGEIGEYWSEGVQLQHRNFGSEVEITRIRHSAVAKAILGNSAVTATG